MFLIGNSLSCACALVTGAISDKIKMHKALIFFMMSILTLCVLMIREIN